MDKAPAAFRTISEVAQDLDVPQHVLRFWESRFAQIRPMKRAGGRRYYRTDDIDLLRGIRHLLYGEGYTIRGVQRLLKEQGLNFVQQAWQTGAAEAAEEDEDKAAIPSNQAERLDELNLRSLLSPGRGVTPERREPRLDHQMQSHDGEAPPDAVLATANLSRQAAGMPREDLRKLQAVLHELGECRQLLDAVLT